MTDYFREQLGLPPVNPTPLIESDDFELPAPQCDRDSDETCEGCQ